MAASVCIRPARSGRNPLVPASRRVFAISRGTSFALRSQCSIWWGRRELHLLVWYGQTLVPSIVLTVSQIDRLDRLTTTQRLDRRSARNSSVESSNESIPYIMASLSYGYNGNCLGSYQDCSLSVRFQIKSLSMGHAKAFHFYSIIEAKRFPVLSWKSLHCLYPDF